MDVLNSWIYVFDRLEKEHFSKMTSESRRSIWFHNTLDYIIYNILIVYIQIDIVNDTDT